jgi:hypothetical protein
MISSDSDFLNANGLDGYLEMTFDPETAGDVLPSEVIAGTATSADEGDALLERASAEAEAERLRRDLVWEEKLPQHLLPKPSDVPAHFEKESEMEMVIPTTLDPETGEVLPSTLGEKGDDEASKAAQQALKQAAEDGFVFKGGLLVPPSSSSSSSSSYGAMMR